MTAKQVIPLRYGKQTLPVELSPESLLYVIKPGNFDGETISEKEAILASLRTPVASLPLAERLHRGMKVVIVGDDLTRATPRERIFPVLLDELNRAGIPDRDIIVLIGLGTHRYMTDEEIRKCFGAEVVDRVTVLNHEWQDEPRMARPPLPHPHRIHPKWHSY